MLWALTVHEQSERIGLPEPFSFVVSWTSHFCSWSLYLKPMHRPSLWGSFQKKQYLLDISYISLVIYLSTFLLKGRHLTSRSLSKSSLTGCTRNWFAIAEGCRTLCCIDFAKQSCLKDKFLARKQENFFCCRRSDQTLFEVAKKNTEDVLIDVWIDTLGNGKR